MEPRWLIDNDQDLARRLQEEEKDLELARRLAKEEEERSSNISIHLLSDIKDYNNGVVLEDPLEYTTTFAKEVPSSLVESDLLLAQKLQLQEVPPPKLCPGSAICVHSHHH